MFIICFINHWMKRSKHGLFVFPALKNPNVEKALFDWPIVCVKAKYRLISWKFSGMKLFHPSVRVTNQTPRAFVSVRSFSFQGQTKIALIIKDTYIVWITLVCLRTVLLFAKIPNSKHLLNLYKCWLRRGRWTVSQKRIMIAKRRG